jgi:proteic killer suppression protein
MIRTFRSKSLRHFFETGTAGKLSVQNVARVRRILRALMAATKPEDMNLPGFYFHGLEGEARWSVRVTGNWRLTFGWDGADAIDVDMEDYH